MSLYDLKNSAQTWANIKVDSIVSDDVEGKIKGLTSSNYPVPSGVVGEVFVSSNGAGANIPVKDTFQELTSITVTEGIWLVSAQCGYTCSDASQLYRSGSVISLSSASSDQAYYRSEFQSAGVSANSHAVPTRYYSPTGTATIYLNGLCNWGTGTASAVYQITAVRVA